MVTEKVTQIEGTSRDIVPGGGIPLQRNTSGMSSDAQVVDLWLSSGKLSGTQVQYDRAVRRFFSWLEENGLRLRSCKLQHLQLWVRTLEGASATKNLQINAVKSLFTASANYGYIQMNPAAALATFKDPTDLNQRILSEDEVRKLIECAGAVKGKRGVKRRALIQFLYETGTRRSEAAQLRWKDVKPRVDGTATISVRGKGEKIRYVKVSRGLFGVLDSIKGTSSPETLVFGMTAEAVSKAVKRVVKAAGMSKHVSPHWFRHAHASHALDHGAPVHLVQHTLGHASLATTSRYVHARPEESSGDYLTKEEDAE